jgi:hypothetical protein
MHPLKKWERSVRATTNRHRSALPTTLDLSASLSESTRLNGKCLACTELATKPLPESTNIGHGCSFSTALDTTSVASSCVSCTHCSRLQRRVAPSGDNHEWKSVNLANLSCDNTTVRQMKHSQIRQHGRPDPFTLDLVGVCRQLEPKSRSRARHPTSPAAKQHNLATMALAEQRYAKHSPWFKKQRAEDRLPKYMKSG